MIQPIVVFCTRLHTAANYWWLSTNIRLISYFLRTGAWFSGNRYNNTIDSIIIDHVTLHTNFDSSCDIYRLQWYYFVLMENRSYRFELINQFPYRILITYLPTISLWDFFLDNSIFKLAELYCITNYITVCVVREL